MQNLQNYLKAFKIFTGAQDSDIQYKEMDGHVVVHYEDTTYLVSQGDDIKDDYRHYFETKSYEEIYTGTPVELWEFYLREKVDIEPADLVVEIYKAWESYWIIEREKIVGDDVRKEQMQEYSYKNLKTFFQKLEINSDNAIREAAALNDIELIPIVAMPLHSLQKDKEIFFDECVSFITKHGDQFLTDGETFECITLPDANDGATERYYIYNPMFEFDDL